LLIIMWRTEKPTLVCAASSVNLPAGSGAGVAWGWFWVSTLWFWTFGLLTLCIWILLFAPPGESVVRVRTK
jgi:hypothetical protein